MTNKIVLCQDENDSDSEAPLDGDGEAEVKTDLTGMPQLTPVEYPDEAFHMVTQVMYQTYDKHMENTLTLSFICTHVQHAFL